MKNDGSGGTTYAYTYNDLKQLTKVEWPSGSPTSRKNYTYDANGNLATKTEQSYSGGQWNTAVSWTYGWDIQDRLISVTKDVAGTETGDQKVEYTYCPSCGGAMRERIEYDNDTGGAIVSWLRYEYEGLNLLRIDQLYDGNSSGTIDSTDYTNKYWRPMNIYLHGPGAIGQIIKSKWYSYTDDQTATPCTTGEYYYFYDAVGNVVGVWDQRDGAYHSWAMDAFGNPLSGVEFLAMDQPGPKEHLTGKMFDTVSGLYYFSARWYDAELGRFVSRDPVGIVGGCSSFMKGIRIGEYIFALNRPSIAYDPNGMQAREPQPELDLAALNDLIDRLIREGGCSLCPHDICQAYANRAFGHRDGLFGHNLVPGIQDDRLAHFFLGAGCSACSLGYIPPFTLVGALVGAVCQDIWEYFLEGVSSDRRYDELAAHEGTLAPSCAFYGLSKNPWRFATSDSYRKENCRECLQLHLSRMYDLWWTGEEPFAW